MAKVYKIVQDETVAPVLSAFRDFRKAIRFCVDDGLGTQALILTFSVIDIAGSLDCEGTSGQTFKQWVDRYMLPYPKLECTSDDLWGARCGLLHTYAPESDRSRDGKARELYYAWADERAVVLQGHLDDADTANREVRKLWDSADESGKARMVSELQPLGFDTDTAKKYLSSNPKQKALAVQGETLIQAYGDGLKVFLGAMESDPDCLARVRERSPKILKVMSPSDLQHLEGLQKIVAEMMGEP